MNGWSGKADLPNTICAMIMILSVILLPIESKIKDLKNEGK